MRARAVRSRSVILARHERARPTAVEAPAVVRTLHRAIFSDAALRKWGEPMWANIEDSTPAAALVAPQGDALAHHRDAGTLGSSASSEASAYQWRLQSKRCCSAAGDAASCAAGSTDAVVVATLAAASSTEGGLKMALGPTAPPARDAGLSFARRYAVWRCAGSDRAGAAAAGRRTRAGSACMGAQRAEAAAMRADGSAIRSALGQQ